MKRVTTLIGQNDGTPTGPFAPGTYTRSLDANAYRHLTFLLFADAGTVTLTVTDVGTAGPQFPNFVPSANVTVNGDDILGATASGSGNVGVSGPSGNEEYQVTIVVSGATANLTLVAVGED